MGARGKLAVYFATISVADLSPHLADEVERRVLGSGADAVAYRAAAT